MFCKALQPLLESDENASKRLSEINDGFSKIMQTEMTQMWASKLGLETFNPDLFNELITLMIESSVDYTLFFRELSDIPDDVSSLTKSFYGDTVHDEKLMQRWSEWLLKWSTLTNATTPESRKKLSLKMKQINPKYTLREWFLVPAYQEAQKGDYTLIKELQELMTNPYTMHSPQSEKKYYKIKPIEFFKIAGISHVSCSS